MQTSETNLIKKSLHGDHEAYGQLVNIYQGMVFAVALGITKSFTDSQDIMQEAFIYAYRKLRSLSNPSKFGNWLYVIAKRMAFSFMRKKHKAPYITADEDTLKKLKATTFSPDEAFSAKEFSALIWDYVNQLPGRSREAILLYYLEGFSVKSAAGFLGSNDSREPVYDFTTSGGRDGLHHTGVNANQGAEATLAWLLALHSVYTIEQSAAVIRKVPEEIGEEKEAAREQAKVMDEPAVTTLLGSGASLRK